MGRNVYLSFFIAFFIIVAVTPLPIYAHLDVWLKNEMGDRITPAANSIDPYSPRRTCGGCHDYRLITSGYHFLQGFDAMSDTFDLKRPWILSPGMFGRWLPTAASGRIAPKANKSPLSIDLSTYDWIGRGGKFSREGKLVSSACGFCHPGGGPMEYGRDRHGRADFSRNLMAGEEANWPTFDGDYTSLDTPDGKSKFRISGVVEADCLICHLRNYDMKERNLQLSRRNYRWAATAGARLGIVEGAVFTPNSNITDPSAPGFYKGTWNFDRRPVVHYRWSDRNLFTPDGRLKGNVISKIVPAKNCLQCHDLGERKNTGTVMNSEQDMHLARGFSCTDCHGLIGRTKSERLTHQIAKGHSHTNTVRADLNGKEMKTCITCHIEGNYKPTRKDMPPKATNPYEIHGRVFRGYRFHTYLLDCMACHAPTRTGRPLLLLDMAWGYEAAYVTEKMERIKGENEYFLSAPVAWSPWMDRKMRYEPVVPKWLVWFANEINGQFCPIPLRFVAASAEGWKGKKDRPFTAKEEEILFMLNRLRKLGFSNPVFIADRVFFSSGNKLDSKTATLEKIFYPIVHGVAGKRALKECQSCHGAGAPFFTRMEIVNLRNFLLHDFPAMKEPNSQPQFKIWGLKNIPAGQ